jgi:hypothetical protein
VSICSKSLNGLRRGGPHLLSMAAEKGEHFGKDFVCGDNVSVFQVRSGSIRSRMKLVVAME